MHFRHFQDVRCKSLPGVGVRGGLQASKLKPRVLAAVAAVMSQLLS